VPVVLLDGAGTRVLERCLQDHRYRNTHGPVRSMPDAVRLAARLARPGHVVLLSPAMTAVGLFIDEADRGQQFEAAILSRAELADGVRSRSRA
jgi:UDP-N-acetylmuramoylalanine-D-glutamate ligase